MKAAVYTRYGSPDVVQIMDVEKPVPKDGEVLIRVRAAAVNPLDWRIMKGAASLSRNFRAAQTNDRPTSAARR